MAGKWRNDQQLGGSCPGDPFRQQSQRVITLTTHQHTKPNIVPSMNGFESKTLNSRPRRVISTQRALTPNWMRDEYSNPTRKELASLQLHIIHTSIRGFIGVYIALSSPAWNRFSSVFFCSWACALHLRTIRERTESTYAYHRAISSLCFLSALAAKEKNETEPNQRDLSWLKLKSRFYSM